MREEDILNREIMVSVIVITYQHSKYIRKCLESIFMQKMSFGYEVIIADDFSTDGTRKIIREYKKLYGERIKLILQRKNLGASKNAYFVRKMATGKYIIMLEGDDYWVDEYKLQKQVEYLENHPEYIGVFHKCRFVDENDREVRKNYREVYFSKENYTIKDFEKGILPGHTATFMYRNNKIDNKIIHQLHNMVGDQTIYAILLAQGNFGFINETMSAYRMICKPEGTNASSIYGYNNYTDIMWLYYYNLEKYIKNKYKVNINLKIQRERQLKNAYHKLEKDICIKNLIIYIKVLLYTYIKK